MTIDVNHNPGLDPRPDRYDAFVRGRWISSFQGFIQDDPDLLSDGSTASLAIPPAQLGAFMSPMTNYTDQVDGFYPLAALLDVHFGFDKEVGGTINCNIGKDHQLVMSVTGTYFAQLGRLKTIEGEFAWKLAAQGYTEIDMEGFFVLTSLNELAWLVTGASRVAPKAAPKIVASGRMYRAPG